MASDSTVHDRLNAELVQLMRQQTGTEAKEVEVMGRTFIVLPEVFNVSTVQSILEYLAPLYATKDSNLLKNMA